MADMIPLSCREMINRLYILHNVNRRFLSTVPLILNSGGDRNGKSGEMFIFHGTEDCYTYYY